MKTIKYQSSNKQPPSIIYSILNSKHSVIVLISSNKNFFGCCWNRLGNPPHRLVWTRYDCILYVIKMEYKQLSKDECFYKRQGEDSLREEEDYADEKVEEEKEERTNDDVETDEFMRDFSLYRYQYEPERKISSDSSETSIPDTIETREEEGTSKERTNTVVRCLCSQCKAEEREIDSLFSKQLSSKC